MRRGDVRKMNEVISTERNEQNDEVLHWKDVALGQ